MISVFLQSMLTYCLICSPVYMAFRLLYMRKRHSNLIRELMMYIFFLYCVCIFSQTIIPNFYTLDDIRGAERYVQYNLVPFETIRLYVNQLNGPLAHIAFYNLAGNIILFVPFGFFIPLLWSKMRTNVGMTIVALIIPIFIEGTQYFIGRSVDIDDVLLNAFAIVIGY
ncbi:MAG: VanZ family protein, partial [Lysinibacillus sp.]